ncbi:flagellar assembly peptidoglycan hydrolase FlgJ [Methylomarinum sp. Ch1-1]|uniref:Peptidoglycan hydrolase FlgJ n=1 Tax=Methylomarinum roseum TaxID=3067653 RepID=A0AAU7NUG9_9GAMM
MLNVQSADVYTDFNGLAKLKSQARNDSPEAIKQVAKQFESVFLTMVLKSMRQAKLADGLLDSDQSEFYRDMYDQQMALHLSGEPGIGLAELIAEQLSPKKNEAQSKLSVEDYLNRSVAAPIKSHPVKSHDVQALSRKSGATEVKKTVDQPIASQEQFVEQLRPYAEQAGAELGVDPDILLAQAALETGWGKSVLKHRDGASSFNLFNIKADKSWRGQQVSQAALEFSDGVGRKKMAAFRAYDSYQASFDDYARFIKDNPRYGNALKKAADPGRYMRELQQAGYATDPNYAAKVLRIYRGDAINGNAAMVAMVAMK